MLAFRATAAAPLGPDRVTAPGPPDDISDLQHALEGAYTIERELGGGGMSRVFIATDQRLGRRVVVKVLLPSLAASISIERFRREITLAAALQHPNIVPVLTAGEAGGLPWFIMPFIDGESLRERIVRGPLSVRETVAICKDVAQALIFAHARGVVHRDIKPGNILLSAGAAVVTDFGVAKALTVSRQGTHSGPIAMQAHASLTAMGTSLGTPAYMAPEQAAADPRTDHRADIYALGVCAYEMLIGTPPFHGRTPQALLKAQLSEPPPPIAARRYDVPRVLADFVMKCLEKEPEARPKSAGDVLRALEDPEILSGAFAAQPSTRRKVRSAVTVGGAAVLAIAGVWWAVRTFSPAPPAAAAAATATTASIGHSLAVLPLTAIGRDTAAQAAADGLSSSLSTALAGVAGMRVVSQGTTTALRDSISSRPALGEALGVDLVLEGTVERAGDRLRAQLRVVNARGDSTLWSGTFDGRTGDVFALQDDASRGVVAAVVARMAPATPGPR